MSVTITNNSKAQQGVWTDKGLVWIGRGQTKTIDNLTEKGLARAKELPFLEVTEAKGLQPRSGDLNPAQVQITQGERVYDPRAGTGEAIQEPTTDPVTGKAPEPMKRDFDPELADAMTDDELRAFIKNRDGKAPHANTGHDKLVALAKGEPEA